MEDHLKSQFGFNRFRDHQKDIIVGLLNGEDTLAVLPTGGGKSLLYQFPATFSGKTTVVVSPLISLMNDQCLHLKNIGVKSQCYHSESKDNPHNITTQSVVYVTPEFVQNRISVLHEHMSSIGLFAIDEAHCVSQWSHDFRTSYLQLGILKREMPNIPILAVTATATPRVITDIYTMLEITEANEYVLGTRRDNLAITIAPKVNFSSQIIDFAQKPTIVYVQTQKKCDEMYDRLIDMNISCARYHGGMNKQDKLSAHEQFMNGDVLVVVATVAFGMGIDKPDIRNVVNYGVPTDIETYYQEIGRAGRDGLPSRAILYYSESDFATARFLISQSSDPQQVMLKTKALDMLRTFLSDEKMCRQQIIEHYFDTGEYPDDAIIPESVPCNICDVCKRGKQIPLTDVTNEVMIVRDTVRQMQLKGYTYGVVKTVDAVYTAIEKRESKTWLRKLVESMISQQFLERKLVGTKGNAVIVCGCRNPQEYAPIMISIPPKQAVTSTLQVAKIEDTVRSILAKSHNVVASNIMNDRVLLNVHARKPRSVSQLWTIDGISNEFISKYGAEFIKHYKRLLSSKSDNSNHSYKNRVNDTYRYYLEGKSINEISTLTGLKQRTIEDHILYIFEFFDDVNIVPAYFKLSRDLEDSINKVVSKIGMDRLKPIKDAVGNGVTYGQIKLALLIQRTELANSEQD